MLNYWSVTTLENVKFLEGLIATETKTKEGYRPVLVICNLEYEL